MTDQDFERVDVRFPLFKPYKNCVFNVGSNEQSRSKRNTYIIFEKPHLLRNFDESGKRGKLQIPAWCFCVVIWDLLTLI